MGEVEKGKEGVEREGWTLSPFAKMSAGTGECRMCR